MGKYRQTAARLGTGVSCLGALTWLLWNGFSPSSFDPEPLLAFGVALVVWILTEIKQSEEVLNRSSSPNDIRVARELLELHSDGFRYLLKDTDLWSFVPSERYSRIGEMVSRRENGQLLFQNSAIEMLLKNFTTDLDELSQFIAMNTVPEMVGGSWRTGFKPYSTVSEEEYERRRGLAKTANDLGTKAWGSLEILAKRLKRAVPESLDEPLES